MTDIDLHQGFGGNKKASMKILIYTGNNGNYTRDVLDYLRSIDSAIIADTIVVDVYPSNERKEMMGTDSDFTYAYFEEDITPGCALNQVISGLELEDDIIIMDSKHIPLIGAIDRLKSVLDEIPEAFAVGPVSNSFAGWQRAEWGNAEEALDWSIEHKDVEYEESLYLYNGVIAFGKSVIKPGKVFDEDIKDMGNLMLEKCVREFLGHRRMYI